MPELGVVSMHATTLEKETGGSGVQDQPQVHIKKSILGYTKFCLKRQRKEGTKRKEKNKSLRADQAAY